MAELFYIGPEGKGKITPSGEPVSEVVETLERLLVLARAGELVAIAGCGVVVRGGKSVYDFEFAYRGGTFADLLVSVECCKARMLEVIRNEN